MYNQQFIPHLHSLREAEYRRALELQMVDSLIKIQLLQKQRAQLQNHTHYHLGLTNCPPYQTPYDTAPGGSSPPNLRRRVKGNVYLLSSQNLKRAITSQDTGIQVSKSFVQNIENNPKETDISNAPVANQGMTVNQQQSKIPINHQPYLTIIQSQIWQPQASHVEQSPGLAKSDLPLPETQLFQQHFDGLREHRQKIKKLLLCKDERKHSVNLINNQLN